MILDRPPDLTGATVLPRRLRGQGHRARACCTDSRARWAYVVAAPGFGPVRQVGIPTSGLYVVIAVVSGPNADRLLQRDDRGRAVRQHPHLDRS